VPLHCFCFVKRRFFCAFLHFLFFGDKNKNIILKKQNFFEIAGEFYQDFD